MQTFSNMFLVPYSANISGLKDGTNIDPDFSGHRDELFEQAVDPDAVHMSVFTEGITHAARFLLQHAENNGFRIHQTIALGEDTFGERTNACTADLMADALEDEGVSDVYVLEERNLNNTPLQIRAASRYIKKNTAPDDQHLVVCYDFHKPRIITHFNTFGLGRNMNYISADQLLARSGYEIGSIVLPRLSEFEPREGQARRIAQIDRRGVVFNALTRRRGAQVDDVIPGQTQTLRTTAVQRVLDLAAR